MDGASGLGEDGVEAGVFGGHVGVGEIGVVDGGGVSVGEDGVGDRVAKAHGDAVDDGGERCAGVAVADAAVLLADADHGLATHVHAIAGDDKGSGAGEEEGADGSQGGAVAVRTVAYGLGVIRTHRGGGGGGGVGADGILGIEPVAAADFVHIRAVGVSEAVNGERGGGLCSAVAAGGQQLEGPILVTLGLALVVKGLAPGHTVDIFGAGAEEDVSGEAGGGWDDAVAVEDGGPAVEDFAGGPGVGAWGHVVGGDNEAVVEVLVDHEALADAGEIGETARGLGEFAGAGDGGDEDADEEGDDGDHDEEFDEGKTAGRLHGFTVSQFR